MMPSRVVKAWTFIDGYDDVSLPYKSIGLNDISYWAKWDDSDAHNDEFTASIKTRVYDASKCIYKTTIGHTEEAVDCSVDHTRYDGNMMFAKEGVFLKGSSGQDDRPWNFKPVDNFVGGP